MLLTAGDVQAIMAKAQPGADAAEVLGAHLTKVGVTTAAEASEESVVQVPAFIGKSLCFALTLLKKFVKLNGEQDAAANLLIELVCGS